MDGEIRYLHPTCVVTTDGTSLQVSYKLPLTIIDGKVANVLTGTRSSMTYSICGCTPRQMNQLQAASARPSRVESCQLGL